MRRWRHHMSERLSGTLLALAAVVMFSTSALLVRRSAPVPSVEVAFWRLLLAGALVLTAARIGGQTTGAARLNLRRCLLYGLVTALHFWLYNAAIGLTTVSNTLAIIYTAPAFVAVFARFFLGESMGRRQIAGLLVVIIGVGVLTGFDVAVSGRRVAGDLLALLSAAAFALYSVAGRGERDRYPLLIYAGGVYLCAALWLLPVAAPGIDPSRYTLTNIAAIVGLAILPLALGHTLYNAALRRVPAAHANVISTLEVVGGSLLAWAVLGETVSIQALIGGATALLGVLLVMFERT